MQRPMHAKPCVFLPFNPGAIINAWGHSFAIYVSSDRSFSREKEKNNNNLHSFASSSASSNGDSGKAA